MSKQLVSGNSYSGAEAGNVTLSGNGAVAVNASLETRDVPLYGPYGVSYIPNEMDQVLLLPCGGSMVCAGVLTRPDGISAGEVSLCSSGGARIVLKNSGEVHINDSVTIAPDGTVYAKAFIAADSE